MHALSTAERVANLVSAEADTFLRAHGSAPPELSSGVAAEAVLFVPSTADLSIAQARALVFMGKLFRTDPTIDVPAADGGTSSLELVYDPAQCQLGAFVLHAVRPKGTEEGALASDPHLKQPNSTLYAGEVVEMGIGYTFMDEEGAEAGNYKVCIRADRMGTGPLRGRSAHRYHGFGHQPDIRTTGRTNPSIAATLKYLEIFRYVAGGTSS